METALPTHLDVHPPCYRIHAEDSCRPPSAAAPTSSIFPTLSSSSFADSFATWNSASRTPNGSKMPSDALFRLRSSFDHLKTWKTQSPGRAEDGTFMPIHPPSSED
ncbi:hypothetical protein MBM_01157 [Drepanopeziza brunnea f. sp. 'multigermtubi' MB_m1]|uniref:Uncharacterized protein n=1 Tax=Marssonina brunnea f. sp. multigermtubi (strain MB_m1) TaxID=1072389 RepID=K1WS60_MARBU|nr:uncharacterized protein MBM_01157 [Drepanopeziza brunnea f. sp. 'multigermtubi' MB_m1]EKD20475.1 hypothetical protein MBM_01157 [Drepanopeziza brunnea f. sp. 'multigermtubi' MB_m1]